MVLFFAFACGEGKAKEEEISNAEANNPTEETTNSVQNSTPEEPTATEENTSVSHFGKTLIRDVYESNENGLSTYLKFESIDGCEGNCGTLTLSNSASKCKYIYTYDVKGNNINAEFYNSDCGAKSSNQTFTFDEANNTVSCYINGQKFVFQSIFANY